jgi:hypothetical protein
LTDTPISTSAPAASPQVIPLRRAAEDAQRRNQKPIMTPSPDPQDSPFVAWRLPCGTCRRAWIEHTHGNSGARFLLAVTTDTIDSKPISEPTSAPLFHKKSDVDALVAFAMSDIDARSSGR